MRLGIVGANGFVGSALCRQAENRFDVVKITRENFDAYRNEHFDILINSAMPSKRFYASQNPALDFERTVSLTANLFYKWHFGKFVQISSVSAVSDGGIYGKHKRLAEGILDKDNVLIVRLSTLYGQGLKKGALYDLIKQNKLYVSKDSRYDYLDIDWAAEYILNNLEKKSLFLQVGARDSISLEEIAKHLNLNPQWGDRKETFLHKVITFEFPSAYEVLKYVEHEYK